MLKPILLLLPLLAACAATNDSAPEEEPVAAFATTPPPDANRMQPGHAPTPYSADQIRAACAEGAFREYETTERNVTQRMRMVFRAEQDGQAYVETELLAQDGTVMTTLPGQPTPWTTLQGHASFPEQATVITPCSHQTQAGTFDAWTYVVTGTDGAETIFVFARDLPGPPLDMTRRISFEEVSRMELVDYGPR